MATSSASAKLKQEIIQSIIDAADRIQRARRNLDSTIAWYELETAQNLLLVAQKRILEEL